MANLTNGRPWLRRVGLSVALFGVLFVSLLAVTGWRLPSQAKSIAAVDVDIPQMRGYNFVGRIDQNGLQFVGYGYLYTIDGLTNDQIFSNPLNPSETTAHFTYYATATLSSRAILTDTIRGIFALDSVGMITFYHQPTPSATFADPLSFAGGTAIATASLHYQDMLSVQSPNRGLVVGKGEFDQITAPTFTLGSESYRFGRPGMIHYVSTFGDAQRTNAVIPISSVLLAGNASGSRPLLTALPSVQNQQ